MPNKTYFSVSAQQVASHEIQLLKISGFKDGATDRYLQIHDAVGTPADTAVPKWEEIVYSAAPFYFLFDVQRLDLKNGLYVCLSDTKEAKTLSTDTMDLKVEIDREPLALTAAGTLGSADADGLLQVWAEADGPKHLHRVEVAHSAGADRYVMVYAIDAAAGVNAILALGPVADGVNRVFTFGQEGLVVQQRDSDGALAYGCSLVASTSGSLSNPVAPEPADVAILAHYR